MVPSEKVHTWLTWPVGSQCRCYKYCAKSPAVMGTRGHAARVTLGPSTSVPTCRYPNLQSISRKPPRCQASWKRDGHRDGPPPCSSPYFTPGLRAKRLRPRVPTGAPQPQVETSERTGETSPGAAPLALRRCLAVGDAAGTPGLGSAGLGLCSHRVLRGRKTSCSGGPRGQTPLRQEHGQGSRTTRAWPPSAPPS